MALQGISSKELASTRSVKSGTLQNACFTRRRVVADLGRSARMHMVRLMNNLVKSLKKNDDKSAVAMLKKNEWLVRKSTATCCQPWQKSREIGATWCESWHPSWVETRTYWTSIIERTTFGMCLSWHEAAEIYFTEELRHAETNQTCEIHESYCTPH